MTEPADSRAGPTAGAEPERPCPAAALEARYREIQVRQMAGIPLLNPVLEVRALGFRHWESHWLGVLVTPWFMNLVLCPRLPADWPAIQERGTRHYVFPAGVFEFIGNRDAVVGEFQTCSLFSPMFEFANHQAACDTAVAAMAALFEPGIREDLNPPHEERATPAGHPAAGEPVALSKRDFLFGNRKRSQP